MSKITYDEAIELAAKLYSGRRLAEMALTGDLGMRRVPEADRPATEAMIAELRELSTAMTRQTRRGRGVWPAGLRAVPQGAGLLGW